MFTDTPDPQSVTERLEKLERQNRRMKRAGVMALIVVGAILLMGQTAPKSRTIEAETLAAHEFVLLGRYNGGHPIALLTNAGGKVVDEPILQFFGPEPLAPEGRVLRMTMGATPTPQISIYHAFGPHKAGDDELLSLTTNENQPFLLIRSGRGKLTGLNPGGVMLDFDSGKPILSLRDSKGLTIVEPRRDR